MKKKIIKDHLFAYAFPPLVKLVDFENEEHIGYLVNDVYDKGFALLPIDVNVGIKHFKTSYIKEIRCFANDYKWKDFSKSPQKLSEYFQKIGV